MEIQNKEEQNTPELTEDSLQDTSAKKEEAEIQEETESQEEQNPSSTEDFFSGHWPVFICFIQVTVCAKM